MAEKDKFIFRLPKFEEGHLLFKHADNISKMIDEINKETDRGAALFSASILDEALKAILSDFFVDGPASKKIFRYPAPLSTFSARQNMCLALGLISKTEYAQCDIIRAIRNEFAHVSAYSIDFNNEDIAKLCEKFSARGQAEAFRVHATEFNRIVFFITVSTLYVHWTERLTYVKKNKRKAFSFLDVEK